MEHQVNTVGAKQRILVLDDEPPLRSILELILVRCGFMPVVANDALHAQALVLGGEVDLVICDMNMPDMCGLEFLRWVRANRPTPFILMTGSAEQEEVEEASKMGVSGILAKPFVRKDLLAQIAISLEEAKLPVSA